jgi:pimeloyl-ACP methyl ester carboxylesterase
MLPEAQGFHFVTGRLAVRQLCPLDDAALTHRENEMSTDDFGAPLGARAASAGTAAPPGPGPRPLVDRAFVRIREGLAHYRHCAPAGTAAGLPLYLHHANPGSSRGLEALMMQLAAKGRRTIAPDTLGYGDSCAPDLAQPEIADFADSVVRILDSLKIDEVDFYGAHTGAHVGTELALRHPGRVRKLIFDGVTVRTPEIRAWLLANYAPAKTPDDYGRHLLWAFHFVRDMALFFPHFARDAEHRTGNDVPSAERLHNSTVEVLKALTTYHLVYNAVYRHDIGARLPLLKHPVLCIAKETDPNIVELDHAASRIPGVQKARIRREEGTERTAQLLADFLA